MRKSFLFLLSICLLLGSCRNDSKVTPVIPISRKALSDTSSIYYAHFADYPSQKSMLPIGIFDSGTGGFTILESLLLADNFDNITGAEVPDGIPDFAGENFQYFADYANMPYGNYSENGKDDFLKELVVKDALFLMGTNYYNLSMDDIPTGVKEPVKLIVMACISAHSSGYKDVDTLLSMSKTGVKLIGVIDASVRAALDGLDKDKYYSIGVLSTPGTVYSKEYDKAIRTASAKMGFTKNIQIFNQSGDGIANAIDGGNDYISRNAPGVRSNYKGPVLGEGEDDIDINLLDRYHFDFSRNSMLYRKEGGKYVELQLNSAGNYARFHLVSLVEKHRRSGSKIPLSSIILGSTHYPYVLDTLRRVIDELYDFKRDGVYLYRNSISPDLRFIDPSVYTAKECYSILRKSGLLALRTTKSELVSFISIPTYGLSPDLLNEDGSFKYEFKYGRNAGSEEITTKIVPFSPRYIDELSISRMEALVPLSYSLIKKTLY